MPVNRWHDFRCNESIQLICRRDILDTANEFAFSNTIIVLIACSGALSLCVFIALIALYLQQQDLARLLDKKNKLVGSDVATETSENHASAGATQPSL